MTSIPVNPTIDTIGIFTKERFVISYRPEWRDMAGSVTAAILLQQILFRWDHHSRTPFYKFKEPPSVDNVLYKPGDSWTEELGFSRFEFDTALKKIGCKKTKNNPINDKMPVEYWTDINRVTYYTINETVLNRLFANLYAMNPTNFSKSENPDLQVKRESILSKSENPSLEYNQRLHTDKETTMTGPDPIPEPPQETLPQPITVAVVSSTNNYNCLPDAYRKPSVIAVIDRHSKDYSQEEIDGAIKQTLKSIRKKTLQSFRSYLDKMLIAGFDYEEPVQDNAVAARAEQSRVKQARMEHEAVEQGKQSEIDKALGNVDLTGLDEYIMGQEINSFEMKRFIKHGKKTALRRRFVVSYAVAMGL